MLQMTLATAVTLIAGSVLWAQSTGDCCAELFSKLTAHEWDILIYLVGPDGRPVRSYKIVSFTDETGRDFSGHFTGLSAHAIPRGNYNLKLADLEVPSYPRERFGGTYPIYIDSLSRWQILDVGRVHKFTEDASPADRINGQLKPVPKGGGPPIWVKAVPLFKSLSPILSQVPSGPALVQPNGSFCLTGFLMEGGYLLIVFTDGKVLTTKQVFIKDRSDRLHEHYRGTIEIELPQK